MDPHADPDRHSFLHTEECNILWKAFVACEKEHRILRYMNYCGTAEYHMLACFKRERIQKRANNHKLSAKQIRHRIDNMIEQERLE